VTVETIAHKAGYNSSPDVDGKLPLNVSTNLEMEKRQSGREASHEACGSITSGFTKGYEPSPKN